MAPNEFAVERRIVVYEPHTDYDLDLAPTGIAMPIIDGVPLYERLGDRYPGIAYELVAVPSRHWLGDANYLAYGRTVILDGDCGVAECCGVTARIDSDGATITWSDFHGRGAPDLPDNLKFGFDRQQYEHAITQLSGVEPTPLVLPGDAYI